MPPGWVSIPPGPAVGLVICFPSTHRGIHVKEMNTWRDFLWFFLLACFTKWGFLLCCVSPLAFVTCESGGATFPGCASRAAPLVLTLARSSLNEGVVGSSVLGVPMREAWRGMEERGRGVLGQSWGRAAHGSHSAGTGERPEPRHHTQMTATTFPVSCTPMYVGIYTHPSTAHGMLPCSYF